MSNWWTRRISRRTLGKLTAGAVGLTAASLGSSSVGARFESAGTAAVGSSRSGNAAVEQNRLKRSGVGLRAYNPEQAWPGFTLFKPVGQGGASTVFLINMEGELMHTWVMPYAGPGGYLTERGTLFYNGLIANPDFPGRVFPAGVALEADWDGQILWEVRNAEHHHDGIRLRNGNVLLLCYGVLPPEVAVRVQGGMPGTERSWGMDGDYLQEVTTDGRVVWEWRAWEHLDPEADGIPWPMDSRDAWTHGNGIAEWPNGDLTVSFRNISQVITISRQTGEILWRLGSPPLSGQHAPTPLANGNLLLFDNGPHRFDESLPYSRVLELDPVTKEIVWQYQDNPTSNFFSPRISNAQRLPNGNTFINEGWFGRFFEVTPDGEVVWEYVNPNFGRPANAETDVQTNQVFRAYRYSAAEIERARATSW